MANRTDNFNRADSPTGLGTPSDGGSAWVADASHWGILSNQAYTAGNSDPTVESLESGAADVTIQATVKDSPPNAGGIAFRVSDGNNWLWFEGKSGNGAYFLWKYVAGSLTSIASGGSTPASGDVLEVITSGNSITCKVNGTTVITATDSFNATATRHGLAAFASAAVSTYDDFSITVAGGGTAPLFLPSDLSGLGSGGPFFRNPLD